MIAPIFINSDYDCSIDMLYDKCVYVLLMSLIELLLGLVAFSLGHAVYIHAMQYAIALALIITTGIMILQLYTRDFYGN